MASGYSGHRESSSHRSPERKRMRNEVSLSINYSLCYTFRAHVMSCCKLKSAEMSRIKTSNYY